MSGLVIVDNTDYDHIQYVNPSTARLPWAPWAPPSDPHTYGGTVQIAPSAGLSAIFNFTGSQVSVFGRLMKIPPGSQPPMSVYSVGTNKNRAYVAPAVSDPISNVSFFNSSVMPYGQYTLVINITRIDGDAQYYLDYIRYDTTDPAAPATSTISPGSSATGTAAAGASSSSTPVGPIVGGVVGGVAAIALAALMFLLYRWRKRKAQHQNLYRPSSPTTLSASRITPYLVPSRTDSHSHYTGRPSDLSSPLMMSQIVPYAASSPTADTGLSNLSVDAPPPSKRALPSPTVTMPPLSKGAPSAPSSETGTGAFSPQSASGASASSPRSAASDAGVAGASAEDSGLRFQPGLSPTEVAPALPIMRRAGVGAEIPPAYTPD
ncbi:hypothetical protein BD413DRAFT_266763 [Trametes elegans]|nr:hypothetical protein BD413DRAFT_266763 [Trametes elegans]